LAKLTFPPDIARTMATTDALFEHLTTTLGFQYDIGRILGRGGMGTVYFARERALDREVAIKVLLPEIAATSDARERFLREARTAARLTHPNIVPLYTFGDTGSVLYYVMGFVDGDSLEARLRRDGRISPDDAQTILEQLAGALAYAHEKGIVHRDIKPDNILIEHGTGRPMLTDFGIAKQVASGGDALTQTGIIVGTPRFMSPEQAAGDRNIDGRSDLYSLGVVAYTMLAGRPPFDAAGFRELLAQQMTRVPVPLRTLAADVPLQLATTIERCLKKDPAERWSDASRLLEELRSDALEDDSTAMRIAKAGGWVLTYGATLLFAADFAWWTWQRGDISATRWMLVYFGASVPLGMGVDYWRMRRKGVTSTEIRGLILLAPKWWPLWWPARWRQPNDVWPRLPKPVRVNRILRTIGFASFFAGLEATFLLTTLPRVAPGAPVRAGNAMFIVGLFAVGLVTLLTSAARQYLWGRGLGLSTNESDRIAATPTSKLAFWKRPQIARLLTAPTLTAAMRSAPENAADLLVAIRRLAADLTGPMRELGSESAAAARQLADQLGALDREIAKLARDADPAERRRLEQRLEAVRTEEDNENNEMRELYVAQLGLLRRLGDRLDEVTARRQRVLELLRVLWLQLSSVRGQIAEAGLDHEVTGRIRSLIADAERYSVELRELEQQA
jgi:hypothetical protein